MAQGTGNPVIVGYSQIMDSLGGDPQRSIRTKSMALESTQADPEADPAFMAAFREAVQALECEEKAPSILSSPQNAMAAALQSHIATKAAEGGRLKAGVEGALEAKFDPTDWAGWVRSFFTWWRGLKKEPLPPAPEKPAEIKDARIAVLSDWGTGMYGAPLCAQAIASDKNGFQIVMHLGDVYYSGTDDEERTRCLGLWPKVTGARNYSLNSNHEMYTGGHGYFEVLLRDPRFNAFQSSSYFAFENADFLVLCLDTAYSEHDLVDVEVSWIERMFALAGERKVVLLSQHQPFSLLDAQGPKLQVKLAKFLEAKKIFAWYWGHEHRCVVYDRHPRWNFYGRCIGHSGMPYFRGGVQSLPQAAKQQSVWRRMEAKPFAPGAIVLDGPNPYVPDDPAKYGPHGYTTLELKGPSLIERICDPTGQVLYELELK
jgi:Calcineurin-like phosphoesterase